ncbi:MAG: D-glycero-beta-D-manno-heptose-7-phosphate kinase [Deltaproteobacteria bacterium]|nr:D-glycero-beta-D-manno-heptose-7-phosphate kinase [Deltaproteobacteria bacterium]
MEKGAERIANLINNFRDVPIVVYGDLMVDHYIWGEVSRISPEAPVVVVEVGEEDKRPGGAGNVVANLVALGAKVRVCGVVGDDQAGHEFIAMMNSSGVDTSDVLCDKERPTTIKTRVIARHQHVVRVDKEMRAPLSLAMSAKMLENFRKNIALGAGIIVSDYAKGAINKEIFSIATEAYFQGQLGLGIRPLVVDPKGPNYALYSSSTVIKPNRKEAQEASGMPIKSRAQAISVGKELLKKWNSESVVITLGEDGMVFVAADEKKYPTVEIDTVAREVFDVSGAGDTVLAVFTLALSSGATPLEAAELANYAAGIVVGEVGTVAVSAEDLVKAAMRGRL